MADDIVQIIENARVDATSLSEFIYYPATVTVNRRLAPPIHTLNYYLQYLEGLEKIYSQPTGTVEVNGEVVKTVRQSINDAIDSAILGEYQTTLEVELVQEVVRATNRENDIEDSLDTEVIRATGAEEVITQAVSDFSLEIDAQKLDTGITATAKFGGVARTQAEKNSDVVSVKDYGAVGDGATNDTDAFNLLEANNSKKKIDLLGLSYVVDSDFVGNHYYNGSFIIDGLAINKDTPDAFASAITTDRLTKNLYTIAFPKATGAGGSSIGCQSFAFDTVNRHMYTLHLNGAAQGNLAYINRFDLDGNLVTSLDYSNVVDADVGHQGLGIDYLSAPDEIRLWTTSVLDKRGAIRYRYNAGVGLDEKAQFLFFGSEFSSGLSSTPTISFDNNYLVAQGQRIGSSINTIRVFDFKRMVEKGEGDHSNDWLYEFETDISGSNYPVQGIACDSKSIWIVSGNGNIELNKRLYEYSLQGVLRQKNDDFAVGKTAAASTGAGTVYEPEGLALLRNGSTGNLTLCVGVIYGDLGARTTRIFGLGLGERIIAGGGIKVPTSPVGNVYSGTYNPIGTTYANCTAVTSHETTYTRIGNVVSVAGRVDATITTANSDAEFLLQVPVASNFDFTTRLAGTAVNNAPFTQSIGTIFSDSSTDTARFRVYATKTGSNTYFYTYSYLVI